MKLQYIIVIFVIIVLPISLVLSAYMEIQIDTIALQTQYDIKLSNATYNAIQAFQINTVNNSFFTIGDSLKRDVDASINTFLTSLSNNLGVSGYTKKFISPYIPAVLFTLYDGYYIYGPTVTKDKDGNKKIDYLLKPFVPYSKHYEGTNYDIVIQYTLDNYVTVYGKIDDEIITKSGYLLSYKNGISPAYQYNSAIKETNNVKYVDIDITEDDIKNKANDYYDESINFTKWFAEKIFSKIKNQFSTSDFSQLGVDENIAKIEDITFFEEHKRDIIKNSIEKDLIESISEYNEATGSTYQYNLPLLTEEEWTNIITNINMVSFMQGIPIGTKYYNNYVIVKSTKNVELIDKNYIYFINDNNVEPKEYHKIDCIKLKAQDTDNILGFINYRFDWLEKTDVITNTQYKNPLFEYTKCYDCLVEGNDYRKDVDAPGNKHWTDNEKKMKAYYSAIAREKQLKYRINEWYIEP